MSKKHFYKFKAKGDYTEEAKKRFNSVCKLISESTSENAYPD